jgi:hypothetical protein
VTVRGITIASLWVCWDWADATGTRASAARAREKTRIGGD